MVFLIFAIIKLIVISVVIGSTALKGSINRATSLKGSAAELVHGHHE